MNRQPGLSMSCLPARAPPRARPLPLAGGYPAPLLPSPRTANCVSLNYQIRTLCAAVPHAALVFLCHNPSILPLLTCSIPITLLTNSQPMSSEDGWGWPVGVSVGIWTLLNSTENVRERRASSKNARCASNGCFHVGFHRPLVYKIFSSRSAGFFAGVIRAGLVQVSRWEGKSSSNQINPGNIVILTLFQSF